MRAHIPSYEMKGASDLSDALALLESPDWRPFAGGTDLMVLLEAGQLAHRRFVSITSLRELQGITVSDREISLGALVNYGEIREHPVLAAEFPMLGIAARETGAIAIQNRGTLGGNIANASPAADTPPALLVYDAEIELVSRQGARRIPYRDFHLGYKKTALKPGELIQRLHLKRDTQGLRQFYRKVGTRKAQAISKICLAASARVDVGVVKELRLALGSVAATPVRCPKVEAFVVGKKLDRAWIDQATAILAQDIHPIDDIRSTGEYRLRVAGQVLKQFLESLF